MLGLKSTKEGFMLRNGAAHACATYYSLAKISTPFPFFGVLGYFEYFAY